jgi:hypothetical protein
MASGDRNVCTGLVDAFLIIIAKNACSTKNKMHFFIKFLFINRLQNRFFMQSSSVLPVYVVDVFEIPQTVF